MRRINIPYVIWAVLLAALMLTATSCRRVEAVVTEATSAATETETSPSEETAAVTEPLGAALTTKEICNIVNERVKLLFDGQAMTEANEAALILEWMLPYLLGDSSDFTSVESYDLQNVTVTEDRLLIPQEIVCRDGIKLSKGEDPEYGDYREVEYSHENGRVYFSAYGGVTTVDGIVIEAESSLLGALDASPLILLERDFIEETEENVWRVGDLYMRGIWRALFNLPSAAGLRDNDMRGTLDLREYHSNGTIVLNIKLKYPLVLEMNLRLDGIGEEREYYELMVIAGPEDTVTLGCGVTKGMIDETSLSVCLGEETTDVVQRLTDTATTLSMKVRSAEEMTFSCEIALEMLDETVGRGTVEAVYRVGEDPGGDLIPLSSPIGIESVAQGEFAVRMNGAEPQMMEMAVIAEAGTVTSKTEVMLVKAGAAVGEPVMHYVVSVRDSADPTAAASLEMDVTLNAKEGNVSKYGLEISQTDANGIATAQAVVTTPTSKKISLTFRETVLTERAKCFLDAYDMYLYRAQEMVNDMATHLTENNIDKYPPVFYINEGSGQGIHYLIHIGYDNGCYIYADILLDVENYDYFYDLRSVDLFVITPSGMSEDASLMNDLASSRDGYTMVAAGEAVYYSYAAEEKVYIWWDAAHGTCGYLFEEPTAEDFPGRVLHRAQYDANGSFRGEVHTFESSVDAAGRELLHCVDCHLKLRG